MARYSPRAARSRWDCEIAAPSDAAENAADNTAFRILAPVIASYVRASLSSCSGCTTGADTFNMRSHSFMLSASSGAWNTMCEASRRRSAGSMLVSRFVVRIDDAAEALDALEQVVDLEVRVAIDRRLHLGALREQRVGLVEQQQRVAGLGRLEDLARAASRSRRPTSTRPSTDRPDTARDRARARSGRRPSSCRCPAVPRTAPPTPMPRGIFCAKPHFS